MGEILINKEQLKEEQKKDLDSLIHNLNNFLKENKIDDDGIDFVINGENTIESIQEKEIEKFLKEKKGSFETQLVFLKNFLEVLNKNQKKLENKEEKVYKEKESNLDKQKKDIEIIDQIENDYIKQELKNYLNKKDINEKEKEKIFNIIEKYLKFGKILDSLNIKKEYNNDYMLIENQFKKINTDEKNKINIEDMLYFINEKLKIFEIKDKREDLSPDKKKKFYDIFGEVDDLIGVIELNMGIGFNNDEIQAFRKIKEKYDFEGGIEDYVDSRKGILTQKDFIELINIKYTLESMYNAFQREDLDYIKKIIYNYEDIKSKKVRITTKKRNIIKEINNKIEKVSSEDKIFLEKIKNELTKKIPEKKDVSFWDEHEKKLDIFIELVNSFFELSDLGANNLKKQKLVSIIKLLYNSQEESSLKEFQIFLQNVKDDILYLKTLTDKEILNKVKNKIKEKENLIDEKYSKNFSNLKNNNLLKHDKIGDILNDAFPNFKKNYPLSYLKMLSKINSSMENSLSILETLKFLKNFINSNKGNLENLNFDKGLESIFIEQNKDKLENINEEKILSDIKKITNTENIDYSIEKNKEDTPLIKKTRTTAFAILRTFEGVKKWGQKKDNSNIRNIILYALKNNAFGDIRIINSIKILNENLNKEKQLKIQQETKEQLSIKQKFNGEMYKNDLLLDSYTNEDGSKNHDLLSTISLSEFKNKFDKVLNSQDDNKIMEFIEKNPTSFAAFISYFIDKGKKKDIISMEQLLILSDLFEHKKSNFIGTNKLIAEAAGEVSFMSKMVDNFGTSGKNRLMRQLKKKLEKLNKLKKGEQLDSSDKEFFEKVSQSERLKKSLIFQIQEIYKGNNEKIIFFTELINSGKFSPEQISNLLEKTKLIGKVNQIIYNVIEKNFGEEVNSEKISSDLVNILNGKNIVEKNEENKIKIIKKDFFNYLVNKFGDKKAEKIGKDIYELMKKNQIKLGNFEQILVLSYVKNGGELSTGQKEKVNKFNKENNQVSKIDIYDKFGVNGLEKELLKQEENKQNLKQVLNGNKESLKILEEKLELDDRKNNLEITKIILNSKNIDDKYKKEYFEEYRKQLEEKGDLNDEEKEILQNLEDFEYSENLESMNYTKNIKNIDSKNKILTIETSKGIENIKLSEEEYKNIGFDENSGVKNPEALKNLINMKEKLEKLNLNFAWEYRNDLISVMRSFGEKGGKTVNISDGNLIDKKEFNIYLKFLITLIGEKPGEFEYENFAKIREINGIGITNGPKDTYSGLSNFGKRFLETGFLNSAGKKSINAKAKLVNFIKNRIYN